MLSGQSVIATVSDTNSGQIAGNGPAVRNEGPSMMLFDHHLVLRFDNIQSLNFRPNVFDSQGIFYTCLDACIEDLIAIKSTIVELLKQTIFIILKCISL